MSFESTRPAKSTWVPIMRTPIAVVDQSTRFEPTAESSMSSARLNLATPTDTLDCPARITGPGHRPSAENPSDQFRRPRRTRGRSGPGDQFFVAWRGLGPDVLCSSVERGWRTLAESGADGMRCSSTYSASTISKWHRPRISIRSRHSRREASIMRSQMALARGVRIGVLMMPVPSAEKTASKEAANLVLGRPLHRRARPSGGGPEGRGSVPRRLAAPR